MHVTININLLSLQDPNEQQTFPKTYDRNISNYWQV